MARRIKAKVPDARILIVLRNQIDWLRSSFLHHIFFLPPKSRTFGDFLNTLEGKSAAFAGLFHQTIAAYYDKFGRENVHVMLLEELSANVAEPLGRLCGFLGVSYVEYHPDEGEQNRGKGTAAARAISLISKWGVPDRHAERLGGLARLLAPMLGPVLDRDAISPKERALLRAFYAASNYHTARLTGLDLRRYGYPF